MNSDIDIQSDIGLGCKVSFSLQLELGNFEAEAQQLQQHKPLRLSRKMKTLIVEDNQINQMVIEKFIQSLNMDYHSVFNGAEAVQHICDGHQYDVILMDCNMPIMNGYDATRAIRRWEKSTNSPRNIICSLTAHAMPSHMEECIKAGMDFHLSKPINKSKLVDFLNKLSEQYDEDRSYS
jgi:CheY-like chemotaxis protein